MRHPAVRFLPVKKITALVVALASATCAPAQRGDPNNSRGDNPRAQPISAEEQLLRFRVPPGFEVQLVAADPQLGKPMNLAFDATGRIWVTCSELYPFPARSDANGEPIANFAYFWTKADTRFRLGASAPQAAERGRDRVLILSDFGPDGRARQVRTFADRLNIPIGVQPLPRSPDARGDAAVVYSIPAIWRLEDRDGDGAAETRSTLYTGFGYEDTHGMSSSYTLWLDGWIYGTHGHANHSEIVDGAGQRTIFEAGGGTYRFRADGSRFERWTHGQTNPFGTAFDDEGNMYTADSHSKPVYRLLRGGYYEGLQKRHDGLGFAPAITKDPHGSTGIAGIAYYGAEEFPSEFFANLFNGNPVTQRINRTRLVWTGASPQAVRMPDFLTCDDPCFRPVQVKLGPDGALYIADFYNPIIGHYEVPLSHPARDHSHGRIWRVVWRGIDASRPAQVLPDLSRDDAAALIARLRVHNVELRTLVVNELTGRLGKVSHTWRKAAVDRLQSDRPGAPGEVLALLFALERTNGAPNFATMREWMVAGGERGLAVLQVLANRETLDPGVEAILGQIVSAHPPGPLWLSLAMLMGRHPRTWQGPHLLGMLEVASSNDPQLIYGLRLALKHVVAQAAVQDLQAWAATKSSRGETLADVCVAVDQPVAAGFLLTHLEKTQFTGSRVAEFVRAAASGLTADKFDAFCASARRLAPDAQLSRQLAVCEGLGLAAKRLQRQLPSDLQGWCEGVALRALTGSDAKLVEQGLAASSELKTPVVLDAWEGIVLGNRTVNLRAAALQLFASDERGRNVAIRALQQGAGGRLLDPIIERLAPEVAGTQAHAALAEALVTATPDRGVPIAAALARSEDGTEQLLGLVERGQVPTRLLLRTAVASALESKPATVRRRVATLTSGLPTESVRLDQVIAARVANHQPNRRDLAQGAKVFAVHCAACHRFKDNGANIGPSLDGIGIRGAARLFEDILDPSRNVEPAFQRTTVRLKSGEEVIGMNQQASAESVTLTEIGGKTVTFPASQVAATKTETISIMPPIFEQAIAPHDLDDLVAYLMK